MQVWLVVARSVQGVEGHRVRHSPGRTDRVSDAEPGVYRQSKPSLR